MTLEAKGSARLLTETGSGSEKRASSSSCTSKAVVSSVLFSLAAASAFCLGAATKVYGFIHAFICSTLWLWCTLCPYSCSCSCSCTATSLQWQEMKGGITEGPVTYAAMSARPTWSQNIPQGPTALAPPAHELSQVWCAVQLQQTRQDAQQDLTVGKGSVGLVWGNPKTLPQSLLHCTRATSAVLRATSAVLRACASAVSLTKS